jgi:hypothetical protein
MASFFIFVPMAMKYFLNGALCFFLCVSCTTTYHFADFIRPSDVYIPSSIYRIGVLNRGALPSDDAPIYVDGIPIEYLRGVPKSVSDKTLVFLKKEIDELGRFEVIPLSWEPTERVSREVVRAPFTLSQIDSICNTYQLDGFIAIEGVDLMVKTSGEVNVVSANTPDGRMVRVPEFTSQQEVDYNIVWRFYQARSDELLDMLDETYDAFSNQVSYTPQLNEGFDESLAFDMVAAKAAYAYHNRVSPYWEGDYRLYYRGPGALITVAYDLDITGNWEKAAQEWLALTTDNSLKVKYGAMYNMAVASEMLGRPKIAKEWLVKAKAVDDTKQVKKYMEQIDRQILIYDVIDQQLGL